MITTTIPATIKQLLSCCGTLSSTAYTIYGSSPHSTLGRRQHRPVHRQSWQGNNNNQPAPLQIWNGRCYVHSSPSVQRLIPPTRENEIDKTILSVLDMFSIGVGPSSSHTVGPMRAANMYTKRLKQKNIFDDVCSVKSLLYGSLALTGEGHGTPSAVLMGLEGELPERVDPSKIQQRMTDIRKLKKLKLGGERDILFEDSLQLLKTEVLPYHSNGLRFIASSAGGQILDDHTYYSVGGGFVVDSDDIGNQQQKQQRKSPPYLFHTCEQLLDFCNKTNMSIYQLQMQNEKSFGKSEEEIATALLNIWNTMDQCIERGLHSSDKYLPGPLMVRRRAPEIYRRLLSHNTKFEDANNGLRPRGSGLDWLSSYSMAVNEENAAGGRVVTAPTNGAAGVIPAVLKYYIQWESNHASPSPDEIVTYLLTAGTIGILFKKGASISAAEVGCQGEIGVACSMAAAGLCALYGGTPAQIENAAEIGMEHHLGMTCDPIGGLVQIPCIERNSMGSIKAVNAAHLAIMGDGSNVVPLDTAIATMMKTGRDMQTKYKETSLGGLALHIGKTEC